MLRHSQVSLLRAQLTSVIVFLIRRSTFIGDELANSWILGVLTDGSRDKQEKVRRFSMADLRELLFYKQAKKERKTKLKKRECYIC